MRLIPLLFLFFMFINPGSVLGDSSVIYHEWDDNSFLVDERVIQNYDPDPDMRNETFTNGYDFIGISHDASSQYTHDYTTDPSESFDGYALYMDSPDDVNWAGAHFSYLYPGNSSTFKTYEFDIMWESESGKGFKIEFYDSSDVRVYWGLNISTNAWDDGDGLYTVVAYGYSDSPWERDKQVQSFGITPTAITWHHVIFSYVDNLQKGFQTTIQYDNITWNFTREKLGLSNTADWRIRLSPEEYYSAESNEYGMDIVLDNIACYNTSYNTEEVIEAVNRVVGGDTEEEPTIPTTTTTSISDLLDSGLLNSFLILGLLMMLVAMVQKPLNRM
jgi:hypothetical protein